MYASLLVTQGTRWVGQQVCVELGLCTRSHKMVIKVNHRTAKAF